jgi:hypothetical protein
MNSKIMAFLAAGAAAALLAGCESSPDYPITYQIPIGYSTVTSAYGLQNLNVSATHDSAVQPGVPMYYQVTSPVNLTLYVFDKTGPGTGGVLLNQTQGTSITSMATATSDTLEFVFSASQPYTAGTVQLTISDRPLPPVATALGMSATQSTTTTTTSGPVVAPAASSTTTTVVTPAAPTQDVMNHSSGP